ncbi:MAG: AAA family ATPase [Deinococcales bacterium]
MILGSAHPKRSKRNRQTRLDSKRLRLSHATLSFSDGSIRFICLITALLQPNPPSTIIIDEPELGLHPHAIEILADIIQTVSETTQVIISTQSPTLVSCFKPEDVIVVTRDQGASNFQRLDSRDLSVWLEDYSLGDLWQGILLQVALFMSNIEVIIIVEGKSEQVFISCFSTLYGHEGAASCSATR